MINFVPSGEIVAAAAAAVVAVKEIGELHFKILGASAREYCHECLDPWPCPTQQIIMKAGLPPAAEVTR